MVFKETQDLDLISYSPKYIHSPMPTSTRRDNDENDKDDDVNQCYQYMHVPQHKLMKTNTSLMLASVLCNLGLALPLF